MLELVRRSLLHLYHSLGAELNVVGKCLVAGWPGASTRSSAEVGRQVLPTYEPEPRNSLWYQSSFAELPRVSGRIRQNENPSRRRPFPYNSERPHAETAVPGGYPERARPDTGQESRH